MASDIKLIEQANALLIQQRNTVVSSLAHLNFSALVQQVIGEKASHNTGYQSHCVTEYFTTLDSHANNAQLSATLKNILMLECLLNNNLFINSDTPKPFLQKHSPTILIIYWEHFARLINQCHQQQFYSLQSHDCFLKDLAISNGRLFPVQGRVIEYASGISRKSLFNNGIKQMLSFAKLLITIGYQPFYQTHIHQLLPDHINSKNWQKSFLTLTEMLKLNPEIKGIIGNSWFYDPAISEISPHLAYLSQIPLAHGAKRYFVELDLSENAIKTSQTRRQLFEQGSYLPKKYYSSGQETRYYYGLKSTLITLTKINNILF